MNTKEKFDIKILEKMLTLSADYFQRVIQHTVQRKVGSSKSATVLADKIEKAIMAAYQAGFIAGSNALWELAEAEEDDEPTEYKRNPLEPFN